MNKRLSRYNFACNLQNIHKIKPQIKPNQIKKGQTAVAVNKVIDFLRQRIYNSDNKIGNIIFRKELKDNGLHDEPRY